MELLIPRQIEAEHDRYLQQCFHDANFIETLIKENLCFVSGRKGTGKTALCRHLKDNYGEYGLEFSDLISLDEIGYQTWKSEGNKPELLLLYILTRTIQLLLKEDYFETGYSDFWNQYLQKNGLQNIEDYKSFVEISNEHKTRMEVPILPKRLLPISGEHSNRFESSDISKSVSYLFPSLRHSIPAGFKIIISFDNISDYLDMSDSKSLREEINVIKEVLLHVERFNASLADEGKDFRFILTIRDDLWDYMDGANVNKLTSNT